ncbi:hypothetical protein WJX72_011786 [[Myrmecia] bisecta]|uniref:Uncharacterized protein n=1 Tax=[Myrmecia] bisecta TaxID=41462 RepID=A0AAW1PQG5_9CHLO
MYFQDSGRALRGQHVCPPSVTSMGGGGGDHFHYPKGVWSPAGGWWADPKHWRRNTAVAFGVIVAVSIPLFLKSAELEQRPIPPTRPIPSQKWCKNFGEANPNAIGGSS